MTERIVMFVNEGIGALLAYLPPAVALASLRDFLRILKTGTEEEAVGRQLRDLDSKLGPDPNPSRKASFAGEEEKFQAAEEPPQFISEKQLIVKTEQL